MKFKTIGTRILEVMRGIINVTFIFITILILANVCVQKVQLHTYFTYFIKCSPSKTLFTVQLVLIVFFMGKFANQVMFGPLNREDSQKLLERCSFAIFETSLPFPMFKECFSYKTVTLIFILLVLKSFHWITEERIKITERVPKVPFLNHLKISGALMILVAVDANVAHFCANFVNSYGISGLAILSLESGLMTVSAVKMVLKYNWINEMNHHWTWRPSAILYLKMFTIGAKLFVYFVFIMVMVRNGVLPLFSLSPVYLLVCEMHEASNVFLKSNRALRALSRLPKPTQAELSACGECVVCLDTMTSAKKLPCGHIYHPSCLTSWFQRQQTCPICRVDLDRLDSSCRSSAPLILPAFYY